MNRTSAASLAELERHELAHWRPSHCEPLGPWLLRAHHGFTGRANSVLALGNPATHGLDLGEALRRVHAFYTARSLPVRMSLPVPADCPAPVAGPATALPVEALAALPELRDGAEQLALRAAVDAAGWHPGAGTSAYTLTSTPERLLAEPATPLPDGLDATRTDTPDAAWLATYRYLGQDLPPAGSSLLLSAPRQAFFTVRDPAADVTAAVARGSLDGDLVGVTAVEVHPTYRRRGLARHLLWAIADWAAAAGARRAFLQTAAANGAAHRLYLSSGFRVHHRYDYLTPTG